MHSTSRTTIPPSKPRRFDPSRRTISAVEPKPQGPAYRREDKNMNTVSSSSPRCASKATPESSRTRVGMQPRTPLGQSRLGLQRNTALLSKTKPKPKIVRAGAAAVSNRALPPLPPPPLPHLDPNCNEPSLPCLCCDGHSPQDNNSLFNHNHNNNNTISIRQQLKLQPPPPPPPLPQKQEVTRAKGQAKPCQLKSQAKVLPPACPANALELGKGEEEQENADVNENTNVVMDNKIKKQDELDNNKDRDEEGRNLEDVEDEEDEEEGEDDDDDEDEDDDDTLVPSCCDCPPSLLDLSLTSSTSSSSTSISSCSDLETDCADLSLSVCSSAHEGKADLSVSPERSLAHIPERYPPSRSPPSPPSLPLNPKSSSASSYPSSPPTACSPDEGYPSAPASPSSDYLGVRGQSGLGSEVAKLGLLDFLESVGEFGKMERFSQIIQVARWDLDGDPQGDLLRDRLDHLDRLESVNRQVKLAHIARLHEKGLDLGDLGEEDLSDVLDEMGNVDMSWRLYKGRSLGESQEFSDAGVDLTAPSDCDEPLASESETSSPIEPPPRPPKPPVRHASVNSDLHTYINISRDITPSVSVCTSPSASPTFYTFRCEKALPPSPPSLPPPPLCKPIPYFTLYKSPPLPFSRPLSTPPIPPPRKKHLARKEAQRLAALQSGREKTPLSLPPPTSCPPPLPPPPTISISSSTSPPAIPPPPSLPPPPSFHALDDEIRKLLVLAGLTQAELLKLSPELGVCVGGLQEEGEGETHHNSRPEQTQDVGMRKKEEMAKEQYDIDGLAVDGWRDGGGRLGQERDGDMKRFRGVEEDEEEREESRDVFRTTSFFKMARSRKKNSGFGASVSLASDIYYSTDINPAKSVSFETFKYDRALSETPPPPPPRPLPPVPPTLPPPQVCTLPANSLRPERFDWLMAFSPDSETPLLPPPLEPRKSNKETLKKSTSGSASSSGSTSGSGSKVMTFKELRNRSKNSSPTYQLITEPDPDPTVITPDPDILYNLKWRREKTDGDGVQWEYTSQAKAAFLQQPPLTTLAAFREMFQKAENATGQPELNPPQRIGCSASEGNLWGIDGQGKEEGEKRKEVLEEEEEQVEVRGTADGGRTWESRTTVSSPPLSLAQSQPSSFFLHSSLPPYRPGYCGAHTRPASGTQAHSRIETQPTDLGPNPYTTQSTGTNPYTTQSTGTNPYTTQSTGTNPYTTQPTDTRSYPYTTQSTGTNPYTTQSTGTNPYTTQSTGTNPYTTQPIGTNPYTTQPTDTRSYPYTTQPIGTNPYTTQPTDTRSYPYTTQSTGTNPYTTQPTDTRIYPYTTQSTGTNPYTTQPTGTNPYTTQPTGTNPYTTQPTGTNPYTTQPTGTNPCTTQSYNPFMTQDTHTDPNKDSHGIDSKCDSRCHYSDYFKKDRGLSSAHRFGSNYDRNVDSLYRYVNDSKTKDDAEYVFGSNSITNFDSLYNSDSGTEKETHAHTNSLKLVSSDLHTPVCTTPYKNVDAMMMAYAGTHSVRSASHVDTHTISDTQPDVDSLYYPSSGPHMSASPHQDRTFKDLPPLPNWFLYHPKNCPLHRGDPPRLSPVGALDPPCRSGAPPPGMDVSRLSSPLFPRSRTLPALAAPLYYPFLYPPAPPRDTPEPPTFFQAPPLPPVLIRSISFAGSVKKGGTSWMGDDVKVPLRGLGLSSLQEKRALVNSVSVAVEAILAQFSTSRTLVQKALSGDSSVNPSLGRLVLQCLCPALQGLLSDGLKPHQSDVISGRRPNSAWGLVQASTRPGRISGAPYKGPSTQALYSLQARVGVLPQLRQSKHRFNAFLFGLLNIKLLDFWLSHLQSCSDVLATFYQPSSFMRLSLTSCQPLFEELLLLLQPLSLLTFNLDLLFQHHHLEPANHSPEIPSPPNQDLGFRLSPRGSTSQGRGSSYLQSLSELHVGNAKSETESCKASPLPLVKPEAERLVESRNPPTHGAESGKVSGIAETSPQLMWLQEKEIREIAPPNVEEDCLSQQAGKVIQQGWGAVVRWGEKLGQNLAELSLPGPQNQVGTSRDPTEPQASTQTSSYPSWVDGALTVPWGLGRLFGASNNTTVPTLPTRRPSQWLSPGVSALTRLVSSSSTANHRRSLEPRQVEEVVEREVEGDAEETCDNPKPLRSVKTLCDYSGTGAELSFQKGEELLVLGGVDHDWIRCRQGDREGLVPIGYASLIM
ncbi:uncharacterized protein rusc1 isoform X2 [Esox lucius]|uniref:uncharacterized protein rusc1 isoform X2 n=1 Tax=Esox lucius TaxID=8010 RepID=UPI0014769822|nr:uncharacterized protein rusc1 isoform X2 [Esox lucius]